MHIFEPLRTCTMYFSTHQGHSWTLVASNGLHFQKNVFMYKVDQFYYRVFLNSLNNPEFGGYQKFEFLIGIPPLDNPMTNLPKEMVGTASSHQNGAVKFGTQSSSSMKIGIWYIIGKVYNSLLWISKSLFNKPNYYTKINHNCILYMKTHFFLKMKAIGGHQSSWMALMSW